MPENQISFKTRVKNALIQYAGVYYSQFVCKDYLLISDAFHKQAYYILSAEKDNFLHLTGVTTSLSQTQPAIPTWLISGYSSYDTSTRLYRASGNIIVTVRVTSYASNTTEHVRIWYKIYK